MRHCRESEEAQSFVRQIVAEVKRTGDLKRTPGVVPGALSLKGSSHRILDLYSPCVPDRPTRESQGQSAPNERDRDLDLRFRVELSG